MGTFIAPADLEPFATIDAVKAAAMIEDSEAQAVLIAPCLSTLLAAPAGETPEQATVRMAKIGAAKSILRAAILRWNEAGTGAVVQQQAGPFGQTIDTRQQRRGMFWPSEIGQLQDICKTAASAFSVDTVGYATAHAPWCALLLGATYCSCGADIAGYPIFEAP